MKRLRAALATILTAATVTLAPANAEAAVNVTPGYLYVNNWASGSVMAATIANASETSTCKTRTFTKFLDANWSNNITSVYNRGILSCNRIQVHQKDARAGISAGYWHSYNCLRPGFVLNASIAWNDNADQVRWGYIAGCAVG